jgi:hypothetical protein
LKSETHAILYGRLAVISDQIKSALGEDDAQALMGLTGEHRDVMAKLKRIGLSRDIRLYKRVEETQKQVNEVIAEIGQKRNEVREQLLQFEKRKRVSAAYALNKKTKL